MEQGAELTQQIQDKARELLQAGTVECVIGYERATDGVTAQDSHIAGYVVEATKGLVVVVNKRDLMPTPDEERKTFERRARAHLRFVSWASLCFGSAKEGTGIDVLLAEALAAGAARERRVPTAELNGAIRRAVATHGPPSRGGRRLKILM